MSSIQQDAAHRRDVFIAFREALDSRSRTMAEIVERLHRVTESDHALNNVPPHEGTLQQRECELLARPAGTDESPPATTRATIDLADFGARGDGRHDDGPAWRTAIAALRQSGPATVLTIPRGKYRMTKGVRPYHLELIDLEDVAIDAAPGTVLLMADIGGGIRLRDSRNVAIRGLAVDFALPPFSSGRVVSTESEQTAIVWRLDPENDPPNAERFAAARLMRGIGFDPDSGEVVPGVDVRVRSIEPLAEDRYRIHLMSNAGQRDPGLLRSIVPGMLLPLSARGNPGGGAGVAVEHCRDVMLQDIVVHASYGHAFLGRSNDGLIMRRCACEPAAGRLTSNLSDAFHMQSNRFGPVVEACRVKNCYDDAINAYSKAWSVLDCRGESTVLVGRKPLAEARYSPAYAAGDLVALYNPNHNRIDGVTRVVAVGRDSWQGGDWLSLTFEDQVRDVVSRDALGLGPVGHREFMLTNPHRSYEHFLINLQTKSDGLVVRNCTLAPARGADIKLKAGNGIIEDNEFHSRGFPLQVCMRMTWQEAFAPRNVMIRRNRFSAGGIMMDCTSPKGVPAVQPLIRHIDIHDNYINVPSGEMPAMHVSDAEQVRIVGNQFAENDRIDIRNCGQVITIDSD